MANCEKEIIGVKKIQLFLNDGVKFVYPDISNEDEVDLQAFLAYTFDDPVQYPKWEREVDYSGNYKQSYFDRFMLYLHGIENEVPETIKEIKSNRKGYIVVITGTDGIDYVFQTPVFINDENTKPIDSHSWNVEFSYRKPTFKDYKIKLDDYIPTGIGFDIIESTLIVY